MIDLMLWALFGLSLAIAAMAYACIRAGAVDPARPFRIDLYMPAFVRAFCCLYYLPYKRLTPACSL